MHWEFMVALVLAISVLATPVLAWYIAVELVYRRAWPDNETSAQGIYPVISREKSTVIEAIKYLRSSRIATLEPGIPGEATQNRHRSATPVLTDIFIPDLDDEGYLLRPEIWNEAVAEVLAKELVPRGYLTEEHWRIISYLRQYYLEFEIVPPVGKLCRDTRMTLKYIYRLFPTGLTKGACKIAGLPQPSYKLYP
ncbi:TusE/DsrC/DsvC family sulfur relay protein [Chloroflexota bacterium]